MKRSSIEILDDEADAQSVGTTSTVTSNAGTDPNLLLLLGGGLLAVLLVWLLSRPASDPAAEESVLRAPTSEEEEEQSDTPDQQSASTVASTSAPRSGSPSSGSPTAASATTLAPGHFLLEEPTGMWLFIGGNDSLRRVDLDTGEVEIYGLRAHPVLVQGNELVLRHSTSGAIGWVAVTDPSEQAEGWKHGLVAPELGGSGLWVAEGERWSLHDLENSRVIEVRTPGQVAATPLPNVNDRRGAITSDPALLGTPHGVFRLVGDGRGEAANYEFFVPGRLLSAQSPGRAGIELCGDSLGQCAALWVDTATGAPIDDEFMWSSGPVAFAEVLGGEAVSGQWLYQLGPDQSWATVTSPGSERVHGVDPLLAVAISPNGRWLAKANAEDDLLEFLDLVTGSVHQVPDVDSILGNSLVFAMQR